MMAAQRFNTRSVALKNILGAAAGKHGDLSVTGMTLDSREVKTGDIFFAYPGEASDGRKYIDQAIKAGAAMIVAEAGIEFASFAAPIIAVENLREKVGIFAANFYDNPSHAMDLIGITGTNGKTTTCQLLAQLLRALSGQCGAIGTLGAGLSEAEQQPGLTTPDPISLQCILGDWRDLQIPAVAMEVSSHALDQGRCNGLQYRAAIFTNLSRDHLDYHGDMDSYAAAKAKLFSWDKLQFALINIDDEFGAKLVSQIPSSVKTYGYSIQHSNAAIYAQVIDYRTDGMQILISTPWGSLETTVALIGDFNLSNLLAAVACTAALGHDIKAISRLLPALKAAAGRMEMLAEFPVTAVVDYAHTPDALEKTLHAIRRHCAGKLWCVFGCGGDRDKGKRPQMGEIAARLADHVIVTSDNPRSEKPEAIIADIVAGIPSDKAAIIEIDRAAAIARAVRDANDGDVVLVAGKGHEDYQLIAGQRLAFSDRDHLHAELYARFSHFPSGEPQ
jgi:UDP-N-acetylmuramoyl-L-alanyl-D-glutamate--2,6-diaminopimelate ligase